MLAAGCGHAARDGHGHESEEKERTTDHHEGEIVVTAAQARTAGLRTETVRRGPMRTVVHVSGEILVPARAERTLVAPSAGVVRFSRAVQAEGSRLAAGSLVATVSAAGMQGGDPVTRDRYEYEAAERAYRRAERLVADQIISRREYEAARTRYDQARAALAGCRGGRAGSTVCTPVAGYVKSLLVAEGAYVAQGQPVAVVAANSRLQLRADVPETALAQLPAIVSANFRCAGADSVRTLASLGGRLVSRGQSAAAGAAYVPVVFEMDNPGGLLPGTFADVWLLAAERQAVISVPCMALTEEQGTLYVYLQVEADAYRKRRVVAGETDGDRVEIVSGLSGGERVVTRGAMQVRLAAATAAIPAHTHNH